MLDEEMGSQQDAHWTQNVAFPSQGKKLQGSSHYL
jgi:hypothetical protein